MKTLKFAKPKTIPYGKLVKKADDVFSLWIRNREKWCVLNGPECLGYFQCSHLIKRGKHSVRFDPLNCHTQCAHHNYLHNNYTEYYTQWFIKKYGVRKYNALVEKSKKTRKYKRFELEEIIKKYKL